MGMNIACENSRPSSLPAREVFRIAHASFAESLEKVCHEYPLQIIQSSLADADNYSFHVQLFVMTFAGDKADGYGVITEIDMLHSQVMIIGLN